MADGINYTVDLPNPHPKQLEFINSTAKRVVIRAGRRGGKTVGVAVYAVEKFLAGHRVLYGAPTSEQIGRFWTTVTGALRPLIDKKVFYKNETEHIIELRGTEQRIRAKTCFNADTLRGDYADELILDEFQIMSEDTWGLVGAPMLLDNNGSCTFVYTPPSLHSRSTSKANDPQHAAKLFKKAKILAITQPERWATFHFSSMDNPHISREALDEITGDMTSLAYRMEILAEDIDEAPGALWTRKTLEDNRVTEYPELTKIVVGVDPSTTSSGDDAGIIVAGIKDGHGYVLEDCTLQGSPLTWAKAAVDAFHRHQANLIVAESNQGGQMVELTIHQVDPNVPVKLVHASRGKMIRAEPVAARYEQGRVHHVGPFPKLEDEFCLYQVGDPSPGALDAAVHALTDLMGEGFFSGVSLEAWPTFQ